MFSLVLEVSWARATGPRRLQLTTQEHGTKTSGLAISPALSPGGLTFAFGLFGLFSPSSIDLIHLF